MFPTWGKHREGSCADSNSDPVGGLAGHRCPQHTGFIFSFSLQETCATAVPWGVPVQPNATGRRGSAPASTATRGCGARPVPRASTQSRGVSGAVPAAAAPPAPAVPSVTSKAVFR